MAQDTKNAAAPEKAFDWSAVMPEDQKKKAALLADTGKLHPIYDMQEALTNKWSPIYGDMITIIPLSEVDGPDGKRTPLMILVQHTGAPTKAKHGTAKTGYDVVDIKAGDLVMVPVGGNLSVNQEILRAAVDPTVSYSAGFRCVGTIKVNSGTPMLDIEAKLFPETKKRVGKLVAQHSSHPEILALFDRWGGAPHHMLVGRTSNGSAYNQQTGELTS